jgi:hypothetical protein
MLEPMEAFETWLLRRVAEAVEAGDVPADLLTELHGACEAARAMPQEEGHARAVQDIAERLGIPTEEVEQGLKALEAQPTVTREQLMLRIAEAWLEGQRRAWGSVSLSHGVFNPCQLASRALVDAAVLPRRGADTSLRS